jgi:hypothetical protein
LYKFLVHIQHSDCRMVIKADAPFPAGASEADWRSTQSRDAGDVNAEARDAVNRDGYSLFRIGLSFSDLPELPSDRKAARLRHVGQRPKLRFTSVNL